MSTFSPANLPSPNANSSGKPRSLLSRIASPFASKSRTLTEFYIRPEEPYKQYFPGDTVRGSVVLTVVKPVRITHLTVCLHGYVKARKTTSAPNEAFGGDATFLGTGRGKRGSEYFGNGFASLCEEERVLCGEGRLKEGVYEFQFEIDFPDGPIPSSIDVSLLHRFSINCFLVRYICFLLTLQPVRTRYNIVPDNIDTDAPYNDLPHHFM